MERGIFNMAGQVPAFTPGTGTPNPAYTLARYEIELYLLPVVKKR